MKPLKYRCHRGGLEESMETVIEVNSREELLKIIQERYPLLNIKRIAIDKDSTWDERIGWETHYVINMTSLPVHIIGYINGIFK